MTTGLKNWTATIVMVVSKGNAKYSHQNEEETKMRQHSGSQQGKCTTSAVTLNTDTVLVIKKLP